MDKISIFYPIKVNVLNKIKVASMMINATLIFYWDTAVASILVVLWSCGLVDFLLGVPAPLSAPPSGFPLYLCSLRYHFARKGCHFNP